MAQHRKSEDHADEEEATEREVLRGEQGTSGDPHDDFDPQSGE